MEGEESSCGWSGRSVKGGRRGGGGGGQVSLLFGDVRPVCT